MSLSAHRSRGQRLLLATLFVLGSLTAILPANPAMAKAPPEKPAQRGKIASELIDRMKTARAGADDRVEAVVVLGARPDPATSSPSVARTTLAETARSAQTPVVQLVESRGDQVVNTFWLKNMVLVRVKPATMDALAALPMVDRVIPNFELKAPPTPPASPVASLRAAKAGASTWGVEKIGADRVQKERGLTGDGVRVAILDTGIDISHPDLTGKLVTDDASDPSHPGGWIEFSAEGKPVFSSPHDSAFHGTHVAGTVAGGNASGTQIGVAPGAELMAGLVIPGGSGSIAQIIAGMQWAVAPYAADGSPAGKPANVVSMSLGGEGYTDELIEPVRNLRLAGAFPAFAIGNDCLPGESSSPGNVYEAVAVGATNPDDSVPDFSCGGVVTRKDWFDAPAEWPDSYVVPDVSAPGTEILSSVPGGEYGTLDGTSMATPHVSGTVALMLQARPDLSVDEALTILEGTSFFDKRYGERPNTRYGAGRIDAYAAVAEAALKSGIRGTVTDDKTRKPLAGVTVTLTSTGRTFQTDEQGRFEIRIGAGTYDLKLARFGYRSESTRVRVTADRFSDVRLALEQTRWGKLSGKVAYGPTGSTVPGATVTVLGVPDHLTATTDINGDYAIDDVPEGTYQAVASAVGVSTSDPQQVAVNGKKTNGKADFALPRPSPTKRVSLAADGAQGDDDAWWPRLSADGSLVAWASPASNLVPDDTNNDVDVFVTDRRTGAIERVSVASDGTQADAFSLLPDISADGRYVGFSSGATNLVPGDTNEQTDTFVRDRQTGKTERISLASDGTQGNGLSTQPLFSVDSRFAVFQSDATNLVPGDTNGRSDVFVRDRSTGKTERVSVASGAVQADGSSRDPFISADGRFVAFDSDGTNLVPGDTNGHVDVFVRDRQTGTTEMVPAPEGTEGVTPSISADGRMVVYLTSGGPMGFQIFSYDRQTRTTALVSAGPDGGIGDNASYGPSIGADGRTAVFYSYAGNLAAGDTNGQLDVFVRDLKAGTTVRVSTGTKGAEGDGMSELPTISDDGRYVAFQSTSGNLVDDDTNRRSDIFVHDRTPGPEPRFVLADLAISPLDTRPGRPVRITASVKNVGEKVGAYDAVLRVDGAVERRQTVQVRADKAVRLSFDVRRSSSGTYTVDLGPLAGRFTVSGR
ncbi:WD40-like Beta Propeller Repeat [Streptosporangium subroseum]|uniref:WD40-like Beta Propeller Repeat n=1 Tax=Streptosporangium subroseum TaxID=106412 RepID=A0A239H6Q3_9ACTN|nr:S8 family serine peptidase [Streptosporangium subroseum]SNS76708.1 WD40-like Beta Propeller Repeat [Streptosporangium subroseum]